jgi:hypothetical protein
MALDSFRSLLGVEIYNVLNNMKDELVVILKLKPNLIAVTVVALTSNEQFL